VNAGMGVLNTEIRTSRLLNVVVVVVVVFLVVVVVIIFF